MLLSNYEKRKIKNQKLFLKNIYNEIGANLQTRVVYLCKKCQSNVYVFATAQCPIVTSHCGNCGNKKKLRIISEREINEALIAFANKQREFHLKKLKEMDESTQSKIDYETIKTDNEE